MNKFVKRILFTVPKEMKELEEQDERGRWVAAKAARITHIFVSNLLFFVSFMIGSLASSFNWSISGRWLFWPPFILWGLMNLVFIISVKREELKNKEKK